MIEFLSKSESNNRIYHIIENWPLPAVSALQRGVRCRDQICLWLSVVGTSSTVEKKIRAAADQKLVWRVTAVLDSLYITTPLVRGSCPPTLRDGGSRTWREFPPRFRFVMIHYSQNPGFTMILELVAIFHASFHPTKGNMVDWSLKASDGAYTPSLSWTVVFWLFQSRLRLGTTTARIQRLAQWPTFSWTGRHVCFCQFVLVIFPHWSYNSYFTKENQHGLCVFRRRQTDERGHRGFRLSSMGILLANSTRPRPWRHLKALKALTDVIYSRALDRGNLDIIEADWEPARVFFEERKLRRADLGGAGDWTGWSHELDGACHHFLTFHCFEVLTRHSRFTRSHWTQTRQFTFLTSFGY